MKRPPDSYLAGLSDYWKVVSQWRRAGQQARTWQRNAYATGRFTEPPYGPALPSLEEVMNRSNKARIRAGFVTNRERAAISAIDYTPPDMQAGAWADNWADPTAEEIRAAVVDEIADFVTTRQIVVELVAQSLREMGYPVRAVHPN